MKRHLIAVIDDDEDVRDAIRGLMRSVGFAAEAFSSAQEFLRSKQFSKTACLITDVNMPAMSGVDLCRHLSGVGAAIPTILITAYPDDDVRSFAEATGIIAYLVKPFSQEDLLDGIRMALDGKA